ncbi:phosphatidate cytidylyltransferase [Aquihabitans sp. G128]|uniref:phosphatidate cytidylyltransferase n=1 Tax=Aquihabitans sp. G128 TaxID=2849779 RepID=UPI001C22CE20|nr:phosphatidate cytidylyltransferase [Aquihabitans sp. G128]QXC62606.1 phosphatidate cytidylyltransferase [Aquihabitans sp. G128]
MDDQRRSRPEDDKQPPAEGVRIIGPDEAAQAIERGDVAARRTDAELRFGDRPPAPPAGPRPALRFPLDASADPTRIERPPVQPAPDPVTGPVELPHWTDPPTGEVPAVLIGDDSPLLADDGEDLDAWSSFATSTPRWRDADDDWADDGFMERLAGDSGEVRAGALGDQDAEPSHEEYFGFDDLEERVEERTADAPEPGPRWEAGDDDWSASSDPEAPVEPAGGWPADEAWTDDDAWTDEPASDGAPAVAIADGDDGYDDDDYDDGPGVVPGHGPGGDRDLTTAVAIGVGMGLVAILAFSFSSKLSAVLIAVVLGLAAVEYFAVLRRVGWESAQLLGIAACVAFPLAVYWRGPSAFPLVAFLTLVAILTWFLVGAGGRDPRVLEGTGATLLGVVWIGGLGSSASALLRMHDGRALLVTAIVATVAYDVGGLFIGRAMGHRPLSAASPNKTLEGLIGGMGSALFVTIILIGIYPKWGPWNGPAPAVLLGLGAAVAAPLGDLCQSLLKRDLGVKDMSSLIPGHGGVLDRFDSMLFVLPAVFWLAVTVGHVVG